MRILVTGAQGQVASALREAARDQASIRLGCAARPQLDLSKPSTIRPVVESFRPDLVINAAAYTQVDQAECDTELAFAVNRDGAEAVAAAAAAVGAPVIQLSTDFVFDGAQRAPYIESDTPSPLNVYGRSKLEGEQAGAAANMQHLIIRTSWIFSPFGANFVKTALALAAERKRLRMVDDQIGRPTYAPDMASALLTIATLIHTKGWQDGYSGVTHMAGPDTVSRYEFAKMILTQSAERGGPTAEVDPIDSSSFSASARRPLNAQLDSGRLNAVFGIRLPPLKISIGRCLDRVLLS